MKYANFFTLFAAFLLAKTSNAEAITLKEALDKAIANSTIRETIDVDFVNDLLIEMRKKAYGLF